MADKVAKLTEKGVAEIREKLAAGVAQRALALEYGVSQSAISLLKRGRNWSQS
jgi:predicted transcriptional regulator